MFKVHNLSDSIRSLVQKGIKGHELLHEWESIVNRLARKEVGEKMIVCSK